MKKYIILTFLINMVSVSHASTLCNSITHSVSHVAFANYLSFSSGIILTFFSKPSKDDKSFSAKLKRFLIRTAVIQLMAVLSLMTFMTTRFFELNNEKLPNLILSCSAIMYILCGTTALTQFVNDRFRRNMFRTVLFILIYIFQMIFQVYMKINFSSLGYMVAFQWVSIFSMMFAIPLAFIVLYLISQDTKEYKKLIYIFIYPFIFQIYLHIGYVCFYLYCDEGYFSSALLLSGGFALGNVVHSAFYLIFPRKGRIKVPKKDGDYSTPSNINYEYRAKALYDYEANPGDLNELSFSKGGILDIADIKGNWWHARKSDGKIGIVPSNYMQITPKSKTVIGEVINFLQEVKDVVTDELVK